jgi:signal peptide peptidase SppA
MTDLFRAVCDELRGDGPACVHLDALPRFLSDKQTSAPRRSLPKVKGRVAVIPVQGVMSRRGYYGTSTIAVGRAMEAAADNPEVSAILLDVDSPGGSAYGTPELSATVSRVREAKPVVAVSNTMAASAAYWVLSAATRAVVTPSGDVGSIGAFILHASMKNLLAEQGIDVSIIRSVPGKADANPYEELTADARASLQASVEASHKDFVGTVAKNRSKSQAHVDEHFGRGRLVGARDALKAGMVDRVATAEDVLREMTAKGGVGARAEETELCIVAAFLGEDPEKVAADIEMRRRRKERMAG